MQRTASSLRTDSSARLADLERRRPEWGTWLRLLEVVSQESGVVGRVTSHESRDTSEPLLHGCTIEVDSAQVGGLFDRLISIATDGDLAGAASLRHYRPSKVDAVELLLTAVRQDGGRLALMADRAGVDRGALASIAHLAAIPLLQSCGELQEQVPEYWPQGYCPVCGAWATLAERRGLDRTRRLRCGRCAGEWEMQWLCCCYCGERDHEKLGSLVPDETGEKLKVETCASCRGYLKSVATLQALPPFELLLSDLETVELDLVARERGYGRPEGPAVGLEVRIQAH